MKVKEHLQAHVANNPQISDVYFNPNGEWLFFPRKGFTKVVSRDEILKADIEEPQGDDVALSPEVLELLSKLTSDQIKAILEPGIKEKKSKTVTKETE